MATYLLWHILILSFCLLLVKLHFCLQAYTVCLLAVPQFQHLHHSFSISKYNYILLCHVLFPLIGLCTVSRCSLYLKWYNGHLTMALTYVVCTKYTMLVSCFAFFYNNEIICISTHRMSLSSLPLLQQNVLLP